MGESDLHLSGFFTCIQWQSTAFICIEFKLETKLTLGLPLNFYYKFGIFSVIKVGKVCNNFSFSNLTVFSTKVF